MKMEELYEDKLAVLIDIENAQYHLIKEVLDEIAKYGTTIIKRAYGDWTSETAKNWKEKLIDYAITPIQQFSYTQRKNSSDIALVIDAMDLLHTAELDGFCLISSDSDFTHLAKRIRESGLKVYGFGEQKTPLALQKACDRFIFVEILRNDNQKRLMQKNDQELEEIFTSALKGTMQDDGYSHLGAVGIYIRHNRPSFDPRNYGYDKMGDLVRNLTFLKIQRREDDKGGSNIFITHNQNGSY
ncbi:Maebl [Helicobacter monodelphidis]|uniref:NYN domain-containing protein n=1 Tax=Helicobacter sp. 15-1451 TaxID=2004995 RepID=UPI000DCB08B7|nr:NYN domain-containing protein [Helicobacter sp. 15-1451]RAX58865.1 Maebl [Helicobacter sp. 15-1451]